MEKLIHIIFDVIIGFIIKIIGAVMITAVLLQIAFRYLPFSGMTWTEELGRLTFVWFCLLSTAVTFVKGQHLAIDYFYLKWNKTVQTIMTYVSWLLILTFSGVVSFQGFKLLEMVGKQRSPVLRLSFFWFYLSVPVGCGLIVLFTVLTIIDNLFLKGKITRSVSADETGTQAIN
ncbi:TRAP transporter small permease [Treponema primitia]|uniref:TRAP transporter small permease n=1 Tax=Treponema primitia TaxID=88058 RepID=UPI00145D1EDA|nr:TRAP transporter small permease [Treponema primitia]